MRNILGLVILAVFGVLPCRAERPGFVYTARVLSVQPTSQVVAETTSTPQQPPVRVSGTVFQVVPGGILFKGLAFVPGQVYKDVPTENLLHPGQTKKVLVDGERTVFLNDIVFIGCDNEGLIDEMAVEGHVSEAGTFEYSAVNGAQRTVQKFVGTITKLGSH